MSHDLVMKILCLGSKLLEHWIILYPILDDKIFGLLELKAFADNKMKVTSKSWVEKFVGKGKNAGYGFYEFIVTYIL